ncbi:MAG: hypothetical protein A2Z25_02360 [Planctomycetes bacterium RBG_16_55_9]|nr:MAG: hypothetical protein A2Z25_02360 [Planctomycetes bacterium RBG_16_55_9]
MQLDKLALSLLPGGFAVCKLEPEHDIPDWVTHSAFWSMTRTQQELSVVCSEDDVPKDIQAERGWRILEVEGPLDLSMTGVLNGLTGPLAEFGISIFVLSTYLTDYLLIRDKDLKPAIMTLRSQGHKINDEIE